MSLNSTGHRQREQNSSGISFCLSWAGIQWENRVRGSFPFRDNVFISQAENPIKKRGISMIVLKYSSSSILPKN